MLKVQEYLIDNSLISLKEDLGIRYTLHTELPLVILNYSQIDSPKTNPIVRECRGLILNSEDFSLVGRSFPRFYNWGEVQDEMSLFDFTDFHASTKEDGSLVIVYHFQGKWYANTRGSFAQDNVNNCVFTWNEAILKAFEVSSLEDLHLDPKYTYVFELVSPWNKVVRTYTKPQMFLLTMFEGEKELPTTQLAGFQQPQRHFFKSIEEILKFLQGNSKSDPTFEGFVICDKDFRRWKLKSDTYMALHHLKGNADNPFAIRNIVPLVLNGEIAEVLISLPEIQGAYEEAKAIIDQEWQNLLQLWKNTWEIEDQKTFALAITKKTKFSGILFNIRKQKGKNQTQEDLVYAWRNSADAIIKHLF